MSDVRPRHTKVAFPAYSYVPGHAPHPVSHPDGHMYGTTHAAVAPLCDEDWCASEVYLYGIDLFNHGYYWESHEAWESLWHAAGRSGKRADFLKGLIKLAAAAVKTREGNPRGVTRHTARAMELLVEASGPNYCGLNVKRLVALAGAIGSRVESYNQPQPKLLLDEVLEITDV